MKRQGWFIELAAMCLVLAIASAISLACLGQASHLSRDAYARDIYSDTCETAAEILEDTRGDMSALERELGGKASGDSWSRTETLDRRAYHITAGRIDTENGLMGAALAELKNQDGEILYAITASWQEGEVNGETE